GPGRRPRRGRVVGGYREASRRPGLQAEIAESPEIVEFFRTAFQGHFRGTIGPAGRVGPAEVKLGVGLEIKPRKRREPIRVVRAAADVGRTVAEGADDAVTGSHLQQVRTRRTAFRHALRPFYLD